MIVPPCRIDGSGKVIECVGSHGRSPAVGLEKAQTLRGFYLADTGDGRGRSRAGRLNGDARSWRGGEDELIVVPAPKDNIEPLGSIQNTIDAVKMSASRYKAQDAFRI